MNRLKELRKAHGISQVELARRTGVSNQAISFYENGKRQPKIETWQKLADFYKVPVQYLQGISNNKKRKAYLITVDYTNYCDLVFTDNERNIGGIQEKFLKGDSVFEIGKHDKTIEQEDVMVWRDKNLDGVENCKFYNDLKLRRHSVLFSKGGN